MNAETGSAPTYRDLASLTGHHVYDAEGSKIGTAGTIYRSEATGMPEWITVKTGLFGTKESFVPLHGAEADDRGLHLPAVSKDTVKDAPRIEEDGHLSDSETERLYRHYGLTPQSAAPDSGTGRGPVPSPRTEAGRDPGHHTPGTDREGTARPDDTDPGRQPVLRSEERLRAGTETVETGRVRLRKHVVTAQEQVTVPVRREEAHVTREPVKPGEAPAHGQIGDEEREVILHEERPVVSKETVPVERVSLDTETVQENREVSDTVRREEVEIDDDSQHPPR